MVVTSEALATKPEVRDVLHFSQKTTEPRPLVRCTENVVKFGPMVFEIRKRTDIHAGYIHADRNTLH